jgi:hypothetical protein
MHPTQTYTLEEQLHRLSGEIMTLAPRECLVKLPAQPPLRMRTPDLAPAWRSMEFRAQMLPLYLGNAEKRSAYLVPAAQVDAEIAARVERISPPPAADDHDFSAPEPTPLVNDPDRFAREFWQRAAAKDGQSSKQPPGRPPTGDLNGKRDRFRVVDGGKQDGDNEP